MSCSSDHEMSSSSGSPLSFTTLESPRSSPHQQVPQLATNFTGLTCTDKNLYTFVIGNGTAPFLRIIEQPQNHFRFRYISEMVGTHGCILGKSCANNSKNKTHPTVELVNYSGRAMIRCQLAQHNNPEEHPHKLLEDEQDRDVSYMVPEQGIYKVGFPGMGIIHTAKKDVAKLLFKKFSEQPNNRSVNAKELRAYCDNVAKGMNLNIVRLKFSAFDVETGKEICEPVFSDPIHNMKSAATNDLKICRISMFSGRPRGGEDVFMFVEKVNKKNIMIRFFELDEFGERGWSDTASFMQTDVHHQYAIVFRTPAYKDVEITKNVKVYIELVRPSDGRTSEPKEFTYVAEEVHKQIKKRKTNPSYSSIDSSSGGSISDDLPTVLFNNNSPSNMKQEIEMPAFNIQIPLQPVSPSAECGLGNALGTTVTQQEMPSPMWAQASAVLAPSALPHLQLDSAELNTFARDVDMAEASTANQALLAEYFNSFSLSLGDVPLEVNGMDFIRTTLVPDSGRIKVEPQKSTPPAKSATIKIEVPDIKHETSNKSDKHQKTNDNNKTGTNDRAGKNREVNTKTEASTSDSDYPAFYTPEDAAEVKLLVRELCEMIRSRRGSGSSAVRERLERLFDIRLSNGDTFLHMTLCSNRASFVTIVKLIHSVKMTHLLNYQNNKGETILHLAVAVIGDPDVISMLIDKGCDPMTTTRDAETCIHYAVRYGSEPSLRALLDASARHDVTVDLDAPNAERCAALHLCALHGRDACAALLCARGARVCVRDAAGRTALHLCAYDARTQVARVLLAHADAQDLCATDESGRTPLTVASERAPLDPEMVALLLTAGATPEPALIPHLAALRPHVSAERWQLLADHLARFEDDAEVKSEPEDQDEYESADDDMENVGTGLSELSSYLHEVARRVEAHGKWRELATRLDAAALLSWFQNQPSPASTLLRHVKECRDDLTSKSLALILDDMGMPDAANVIKSYIE